jgi:hypothetical protein
VAVVVTSATDAGEGGWPWSVGVPAPMFFFFSNRLGCLGSLLVTVIGTVVLLLILSR